ncbi:MAG: succinate dehydrogenase assembly factor 2 [Alcanivoracaceae bacterium]|nr:succinate dehydrogenase assembly factor 2 [Alcanivoracaceae bacterium]
MAERLKKGYLQWRCRRGTKELDVVLNSFLDNRYEGLTDSELLQFDQLLNTQDTELWYWLSGQDQPSSVLLKKIISIIRNNAHFKG